MVQLGVSFRLVVADDAPLLLEIFAATRAAEMAVVNWDDHQKHAFLTMQQAAQSRDYSARFPNSNHDIIEVEGRPVGRLWVDRSPGEIRVIDISILEAHQGRGIGRRIFLDLQAEATRDRCVLRESVFVQNHRARALYSDLGFEVVSESGGYQALEWRPQSLRKID